MVNMALSASTFSLLSWWRSTPLLQCMTTTILDELTRFSSPQPVLWYVAFCRFIYESLLQCTSPVLDSGLSILSIKLFLSENVQRTLGLIWTNRCWFERWSCYQLPQMWWSWKRGKIVQLATTDLVSWTGRQHCCGKRNQLFASSALSDLSSSFLLRFFLEFFCWNCLSILHCVPKNAHIFIFWITSSKINRF